MNNMNKRGYSQSINMLRFPLAVLVVFIHCSGSEIDMVELHANGFSGIAIYDYTRTFISNTMARCAVPLFFIFSGYLYFQKIEKFGKSEYIQKVRKRIQSLIIPYFVWNALMLSRTLAVMIGGILLFDDSNTSIKNFFIENGWWHLFWDSSVWGEKISWLGVASHYSGPILYPFWYMRDLIVMVVFSPVIYWLVKNLKLSFIILLLVIYTSDIVVPGVNTDYYIASFFFCIGAYWGIRRTDFTTILWRWRYAICPLAVLLLLFQTYTGPESGGFLSQLIRPWMIIFGAFAFIILASYLCKYQRLYRLNCRLSSASFFIYAFHPFVLGVIVAAFQKVLPMDSWYVMTFNYFSAHLVCVAIGVGIYAMMKKWMPCVLSILMGERKTKY